MAGLGSMLGFGGVSERVAARRNTLMGLSAGLLSGDLGNAPRYAMEGMQADNALAKTQKEEAERKAEINQTTEWLRANYPQFADLPPAQGFELASKLMAQQQGGGNAPASVQEYEFYANQAMASGQQPMPFEEWRKGANQTVRAGVGQPMFGRNKTTGTIEPWQSMTDGTAVNLVNPDANPADYDFNPGVASGARTTGAVDAKTAGAARAALPGAQMQRDITLQAIDKVTGDQAGLNEWFGQFGPRGVYVHPGSNMGNWVADFSQADNQAFLQARQFLKGQGAITELESAKAEGAYSRMAAAKETGDMKTFLAAAADFKQAVLDGYAKLEQTAAGADAQDPMLGGAPQAGGGNTTSTGVSWSVGP